MKTTEKQITHGSQFAFGLAVLPVEVTDRDIQHGTSRSCTGCAVALALNRALPRFGFQECHVRLVPYACFAEADGLEILTWQCKTVGYIPPRDLPAGLVEWSMDFDDWSEFKDSGESVRAWEKRTGSYPFRPSPISFVFNFGNLKATGGAR